MSPLTRLDIVAQFTNALLLALHSFRLAATEIGGRIWTSGDAGATWLPRDQDRCADCNGASRGLFPDLPQGGGGMAGVPTARNGGPGQVHRLAASNCLMRCRLMYSYQQGNQRAAGKEWIPATVPPFGQRSVLPMLMPICCQLFCAAARPG